MTTKETYRQLCETEGETIPLFLQHWWMEAACNGKQWDVALAHNKEGRIVGALPYLIGKRLGMNFILQPQLTPFSGPWFRYSTLEPEQQNDPLARLQFEQKVYTQLYDAIDALRLSVYLQRFAPQINNWHPLYTRGYRQTTRYTYRIEDISQPDNVFAAFTSKRRQQLRKWQDNYTFETTADAKWFANYHAAYWQRKGEDDKMSKAFISHLAAAAIERGQGVIMRLADSQGDHVAAAFVVYDSHSAYLLQTAHNTHMEQQMPVVVLIWKALQWLSLHTRAFDFEGSMTPSLAHFYSTFGALPTQYFELSRYSNPLVQWYLERKN